MKKIIISLLISVIFFVNFNSLVYAAGSDSPLSTDGGGGGSTTTDDGSWVQKAFSAAYDFLSGDIDSESTGNSGIDGAIDGLVDTFSNIIRAVNIVLLVALAGLSMIALSVVGIKYIMGGSSPDKKRDAAESLKTVFMGMAYGFGAYLIWNIAMMVVRIVISALS